MFRGELMLEEYFMELVFDLVISMIGFVLFWRFYKTKTFGYVNVILGIGFGIASIFIALSIIQMGSVIVAYVGRLIEHITIMIYAIAFFILYFENAETVEKSVQDLTFFQARSKFTYIVKEENEEKAVNLFMSSLKEGKKGLCITRVPIDKLEEKYGMKHKNVKNIWLTNISGENTLPPTSLVKLQHTIKEFLMKYNDSVVLLIGLEYLITYNEFTTVLQFIDGCNDYIIENNSIMILSVSPEAFENKELKLLERNMEIIESSARLSEGLMSAQFA
jgi:hypothetical protein